VVELLEKAVEQIQMGGWVMYPLILTCLWMWFLIGKKTVDMRAFTKGDRRFDDLRPDMGKAKYSAAAWQRFLIDGFKAEKTGDRDLDENVIESHRLHLEMFINRYTGTIALLSSVAPLLGLLGTVSGMVTTFSVIAEFGTGNARALASGISEALITTQTGLVVAVPGLFLASFLLRRANELLERIHRFCLRLSRTDLDAA
jgi:biopolymer transport protein ExbB